MQLQFPRSPSVAILLGAGASKTEGAPLQGELFREYFLEVRSGALHERSTLAKFFKDMFAIDVHRDDLKATRFPTFEEVLGLTDLALLRRETFRGYHSGDSEDRGLRGIANDLVFLVADILDRRLRERPKWHPQLVAQLAAANRLLDSVFISTNYDILIDNSLSEVFPQYDLDYGVPLRNFDEPTGWRRPSPDRSVFLFKPHGSLNWLHCPTCNDLRLTPFEKSVLRLTRLIEAQKDANCERCQGPFRPVLVPPSFYKDLNNVFLAQTWNRLDNALRPVQHVVVCGYSFPDADVHIKYILKRAQVFNGGRTRLTVVNSHKGKLKQQRRDEEERFRRFWGANLDYSTLAFEEFAANPLAVLGT